jgi:hypothetical protein
MMKALIQADHLTKLFVCASEWRRESRQILQDQPFASFIQSIPSIQDQWFRNATTAAKE